MVALNLACPLEFMRFTLTFDGELPSSGTSPKPKEKWAIRRHLHPQLKELWQTNSVLKRIADRSWLPPGGFWNVEQHHKAPEVPFKPEPGWTNLCAPLDRG